MTVDAWVDEARQKLAEAGISSGQIDAELILGHTLSQDRTFLITHAEAFLNPTELATADILLKRRLNGEPIAYILGHKEFYGRSIKTDQRALIPRGETEVLVDSALNWIHNQETSEDRRLREDDIAIAEIGVGSGAIILTLAKQKPNHTYYAIDISQEALSLAQENARNLVVHNVTFMNGDLAEPLIHKNIPVDLLVANLPYIPSDMLKTLDPTVTYYEPHLALDGGKDGLAIYRDFFPQAKKIMNREGFILCEHDHDQGGAMRHLAESYWPTANIKTLKDLSGHDRVLCIGLAGV